MIKPLFDNVLLEKEKVSRQTTSGIVLATKEENANYGIVIALGDGKMTDGKKVELPLKIGDKVIYQNYEGHEIKQDGKEYLIISAKNIIAIIS